MKNLNKSVTPNCLDCWSAPAIVYTSASPANDLGYPATSVLTDTRDDVYAYGTSHWVDNQINGEFIIDLGCTSVINFIKIRNSGLWNRGVKKFSIYIALNQEGPWTRRIMRKFEDPRWTEAAEKPIHEIPLVAKAKYIKFVCEEYWGIGAALQYLEAFSNYYGRKHFAMNALTFNTCDHYNVLGRWHEFMYVTFFFLFFFHYLFSVQTIGLLQIGAHQTILLLILVVIPR